MSSKPRNSVTGEETRVRRGRPNGSPLQARPSFVEQVLRGTAEPNDIYHFIEQWHENREALGLAEYLGFSPMEYARWVVNPECLQALLGAKLRRWAGTRRGAIVEA